MLKRQLNRATHSNEAATKTVRDHSSIKVKSTHRTELETLLKLCGALPKFESFTFEFHNLICIKL